MSDLIHEKFARLINQVEELEEQLADLEGHGDAESDGALAGVRERLQEARNELSRVSNGCGTPRPGR